MSSLLMLYLSALASASFNNQTHNSTSDDVYYKMDHFWTNTGFCSIGNVDNQTEITKNLLSDPVKMNLRQIAALPNGSVTHLRIHWLLQLIEFVQFSQSGIPIYDYTNLDKFIAFLDDLDLNPVIEFMGNPGNLFFKNPNYNDIYWENLAFQTIKHYLNSLGASKVERWRYETWNEPDLLTYNKLNFSQLNYLSYVDALRRGLTAAARRPTKNLIFQLRGPAGLFKSAEKHPLCWSLLQKCNLNPKACPIDILTYHRKGDGHSMEIMQSSLLLFKSIFEKFPNLKRMPISNDEADPIKNWSAPQEFREDVRYATILTSIVMDHWSAKLKTKEFRFLDTISHDNAFLSYYPHIFSQRTLLAHFQMNNSIPNYSQFIQKPVYAALGMLSKLTNLAADIETIEINGKPTNVRLLKSTVPMAPIHFSWILVADENNNDDRLQLSWQRNLSFPLCKLEMYAIIIEYIDLESTNPARIWRQYNSPAYPNATIREEMRRSQSPRILLVETLNDTYLNINFEELYLPWVMLVRVCSNLLPPPKQPQQLLATRVTKNEVFLTWRELHDSTQCLQTYELWFKSNVSDNWEFISNDWHLPFPSFQFAPNGKSVNGFYKVRAMDIFSRYSIFSDAFEYIEI